MMRKNIPLVTSNLAKYALFQPILERLGVELVTPHQSCYEIQSEDWVEIIKEKARAAARSLGRPCIVDDAGLLLDAYPGFPGAYTKSVIRSLGSDGLVRLLNNQTPSGRLVANLACSDGVECFHWMGSVQGSLVPSEVRGEGPGPLPDRKGVTMQAAKCSSLTTLIVILTPKPGTGSTSMIRNDALVAPTVCTVTVSSTLAMPVLTPGT